MASSSGDRCARAPTTGVHRSSTAAQLPRRRWVPTERDARPPWARTTFPDHRTCPPCTVSAPALPPWPSPPSHSAPPRPGCRRDRHRRERAPARHRPDRRDQRRRRPRHPARPRRRRHPERPGRRRLDLGRPRQRHGDRWPRRRPHLRRRRQRQPHGQRGPGSPPRRPRQRRARARRRQRPRLRWHR